MSTLFSFLFVPMPNHQLIAGSTACQVELHSWGAPSQVEFDQAEESMHVASHDYSEGPNFKMLDLNFDRRVTISNDIKDLVGEILWRMKSIMRVQRCHTVAGMANLCKAKVLPHAEC